MTLIYITIIFQTKNVDNFCPSPDYIWKGSQAFTVEKHQTDFVAEVNRYAKENVALVTIYIREPFAEEILISEKVSIVNLMSDVGGLLGLFMGCSFVSALEIIYHILKVHMYSKYPVFLGKGHVSIVLQNKVYFSDFGLWLMQTEEQRYQTKTEEQ